MYLTNKLCIHTSELIKLFFIIILLQISYVTSYAQSNTAKQTYDNAIDEINCLTLKKLLVSYSRQSVAQSIKQCKYSEIDAKLKTVKENVTKGYKADFIDFAKNINAYKSKIENPTEYALYAASFQELTAYITKNFQTVCNRYNKNDLIICADASQKSLDLQANINAITAKALAQIAQNTYNGTTSKGRTPSTAPTNSDSSKNSQSATNAEKIPISPTATTTQTIESQLNTPATPPAYESNDSTLTIIVALLIGVIGSLIWSFKEISDLKKEIATLKKLNAITKQP